VPVPALRVEIVAQARYYSRTMTGTDTILIGPGRAWTMLFRVVPGLAHRVSAKWPSIAHLMDRRTLGRVTLAECQRSDTARRRGRPLTSSSLGAGSMGDSCGSFSYKDSSRRIRALGWWAC
jgi:hypothetical protein